MFREKKINVKRQLRRRKKGGMSAQVSTYINAVSDAKGVTSESQKAHNVLYKKVTEMVKDAQKVFIGDKQIQKLFSFKNMR